MVFQSYALYPHMTVRQNLAFGLRMRGTRRARSIAERVDEAARALGLEPVLDRKPAQLSGGQRQRVALGRAIVREPKVFLFDEPLSNLDAKLRVETRAELARLHRRLGATMVYVTHDQEEAMTLGGRVAVMRDGLLQQVAPPMELYRRPANRFVARVRGLAGDELPAGRGCSAGDGTPDRPGRRWASGRTTSPSWRPGAGDAGRLGGRGRAEGERAAGLPAAGRRAATGRSCGWWRRPSPRSRRSRWWGCGSIGGGCTGSRVETGRRVE